MDPFYVKLLTIPVIFIAGYYSGLIPLRIKADARGERQFAKGNAFSLGIFLGAGILHLLPDAEHHWLMWQGPTDFPWPGLIAGLGLLGILVLEESLLGGSEDLGSQTSDSKSFYPYLLCIVLSIHSIIAGISLGLETAMLSTLVLIVALLAHKGSAAFALGVSLRKAEFSVRSYRGLIILFSITVPVGILLGMMFSNLFTGKTNAGFEAVFDALAAGTFFYIALIDILPEVFESKTDQWIKLMLCILGFAFMTAIAIIA